MLRHKLAITLTITCVIVFCAVGVYRFLHIYDPPPSWDNPLIYPGSQEVGIEPFDSENKYPGEDMPPFTRKIVTFRVAASAEKVLEFYADSLSKEGWKPDTWGRKVLTPGPDTLTDSFTWTGNSAHPAVYFIDAIITPSTFVLTTIELRLLVFPGY